jgi:hypothetical protein
MTESVVIPDFDRDVPTADAVPIKAPPSRKRLEEGTVLVSVEAIQPGLSSRQSLYQIATTFRVVEPPEFAGALIWENFVIGDRDDPMAEQLDTWGRTVGGSRFRRYADRAKVPFGRISAMVPALLATRVVVDMYTAVESPKKADGSPNPYAGKVNKRIRDFFAVNEKALAARGADYTPGGPATATVAVDGAASQVCPICSSVMTAAEFLAHAPTHE